MKRTEMARTIWSLLTLSAVKRQTLTYHLVAKLLGVPRSDLGRLLEPVQSYCILSNLPPLTSIVVNSRTGTPDAGFIAASNLPQAQAETFEFDWVNQTVPTAADFRQATEALPSCGLTLHDLMKQIR